MPDLFVHRAVHNARHKFGPSVHPVRHVSSPIRSQTMQVQTLVGVIPNPIGDIVGWKILLVDQGQLTTPEHSGTIGIVYRFPAALVCLWISS